jgi:hypothetical protein
MTSDDTHRFPNSAEDVAYERTTISSGRWTVVAMFAFGLLAVAVMWVYAVWHTAPYRPLQRALAEEFAGSTPKVEGGQRKIHEGSPKTLRIVMRVEFDPELDQQLGDNFATRVVGFAAKHHEVNQYELIELHFFQPQPEKRISQRTIEFPVAELPAAKVSGIEASQ